MLTLCQKVAIFFGQEVAFFFVLIGCRNFLCQEVACFFFCAERLCDCFCAKRWRDFFVGPRGCVIFFGREVV